MATAKETTKTNTAGLEKAVKTEVAQAQKDASTGNVATVKESAKQPAESLPTGEHSRR